ncbi:hypothetical protein [Spirosoma areae]
MKIPILVLVAIFFFSCSDNNQQAKVEQLEKEIHALKKQVQAEKVKPKKQPKRRTVDDNLLIMTSDSESATIEQPSPERAEMFADLDKVTAEIANVGYYNLGMGGIHSVIVKVKNPTKLYFNYMNVRLAYIKASGEVFKNEEITFYRVEPFSERLLPAPESQRGTLVRCGILRFDIPGAPELGKPREF